MIVDNKIRHIIRNGEMDELEEYIEAGGTDNIVTMDNSLFGLFSEGKISAKTAIQAAKDQEKMRERVNGG